MRRILLLGVTLAVLVLVWRRLSRQTPETSPSAISWGEPGMSPAPYRNPPESLAIDENNTPIADWSEQDVSATSSTEEASPWQAEAPPAPDAGDDVNTPTTDWSQQDVSDTFPISGQSSTPLETSSDEVAPNDEPSKLSANTSDDIIRIEGVGPKISTILNAAGITTFAQLAETTVEQLETILRDAHIQIANPSTWPAQAQLAADGKWEELTAFQKRIVNGRLQD